METHDIAFNYGFVFLKLSVHAYRKKGLRVRLMKNTLRLFQLLLAVFGFYAALNYDENLKNYVPLASLVLIWGLDKFEGRVTSSKKEAAGVNKNSQQSATDNAKSRTQLAHALLNKNLLMITDTIEGLFWDLGISVSASFKYKLLDRVFELEGQQGQVGLKIVGDVDEITANVEQLVEICESPDAEKERLRILLIVNNAGELSKERGQQYKNISSQVKSMLVDKKIIAITTQTLHEVYRLCTEKKQNPNRIFSLIHQHPGGVFRL